MNVRNQLVYTPRTTDYVNGYSIRWDGLIGLAMPGVATVFIGSKTRNLFVNSQSKFALIRIFEHERVEISTRIVEAGR
jgi:hypothetical protein